MKKLRVRVWGCLARNASASRRRSCHPERPGVIIITENREGLRKCTSGACRISPLLMLMVTGLASVRGYFADTRK